MTEGLGRFARLRARLLHTRGLTLLVGLIAGVAVWSHVRLLTKVPMGFYKDETSIAYNAYLIATTGHDEFGVSWPMYTESFGDYKNAGYVYLSVLVMRVFGLSAWTVRLPSVLCWLAGSCFFYSLGCQLWSRAESRIFLLLQLAFTPSLFCLSRIAFEVIGLYPALALFLLGIYQGFERKSFAWAVVAGVAIGSSTYMYTTFRLLAPLHCVLVLLCYFKREYIRQLVGFAAAAACTVVPFAWYLYGHGEQLTARYREIGYAHRPIPLVDKLKMFAERYSGYFDANYLLLHGDPNTRHHTGYGGELFIPTVVGLVLAVAAILFVRRARSMRFNRLLLGGLVLSPVAAALTNDGHHSLQAFSLVVFAIPLSVCGFCYALSRGPRVLPALVVICTALNAGLFVKDYYGPYRTASITAFEFFGNRQAIEKALRLHASRVVIDSRRHGRHAELHAAFYSVILAKTWRGKLPPLVPGRPADVQPGEFFVFQDSKNDYPDLHEGLPEGSLYVAAPYERAIMLQRRRNGR